MSTTGHRRPCNETGTLNGTVNVILLMFYVSFNGDVIVEVEISIGFDGYGDFWGKKV